jgi:chromosome segregation ATPase
MPIDTSLVIQYLALALGVSGVVLSLSYPQSLANRLRLAISSNTKKTEEVTQKVDEATAKMESAIKNMEKTSKSIERTANEIDELNTSINDLHRRIDGVSRSLIAAQYTLKKNSKDLANLTVTVQNMGNKLATLGKSGNELESEISKLGKVTLWAEKNVKELRSEVKQVKTIAKTHNGHGKMNGNGRHNGNGKHFTNGNGNGKEGQKVLVKEKTV